MQPGTEAGRKEMGFDDYQHFDTVADIGYYVYKYPVA